jgi:uncharacterized membrane protein YhiD involved in acid resistance
MKNDDRIVGITTAAFIWVIAGIGILCGMGGIIMPVVLTFGLLIVSYFLGKIEQIKKEKTQR